MEEKKLELKNVRLILRPSTPLLKLLVIILVVFSMAALIALSWVQHSIGSETEALRKEAAALEQKNQELEQRLQNLESADSVQAIAREELGLVDPDTVFMKPE